MNKGLCNYLFVAIAILAFSTLAINSFAESVPRPEYPRSQFERAVWTNLKGVWTYIRTDLWTAHSYVQNPEEFKNWLTPNEKRPMFTNYAEEKNNNQPYILDEYGGIKWVSKSMREFSWGYSEPKPIEEYYDRLSKLTDAILTTGYITGYCYTQFTDVEQEQNGICNFDRSLKFDTENIKAIFSKILPDFMKFSNSGLKPSSHKPINP